MKRRPVAFSTPCGRRRGSAGGRGSPTGRRSGPRRTRSTPTCWYAPNETGSWGVIDSNVTPVSAATLRAGGSRPGCRPCSASRATSLNRSATRIGGGAVGVVDRPGRPRSGRACRRSAASGSRRRAAWGRPRGTSRPRARGEPRPRGAAILASGRSLVIPSPRAERRPRSRRRQRSARHGRLGARHELHVLRARARPRAG